MVFFPLSNQITIDEDKLVVAFAGYLELYDLTISCFHDLIRKQQAWRKISVVLQKFSLFYYFIIICALRSEEESLRSEEPQAVDT